MKTKLFLILFFLSIVNSKAQIGFHKFSVYGNSGLSISNNFDFKPTFAPFTELGGRYYLGKGLSVGLNINAVFFKKDLNLNDYVASFYTQYNAISISTLYENEIFTKWFLGIGTNSSFGLFTGKIYEDFGARGLGTSGIFDTYFARRVLNFSVNLNLRKHMTDHFDFQTGVTYNHFQSYYLDMYNINDKLDTYYIGYVGLVYKFGEADGVGVGINSKRLKCPNVNY